MAARARNAAQRGGWIVGAGALAVAFTVGVLVLVPREADRLVQQRLAAIPSAPDSMPVVQRLDSLQQRRAHVQRQQQMDATQRLAQTPMESLHADTVAISGRPGASPRELFELQQRIAQTRQSMLPESFRALGAQPVLRADARVAPLLDSIDRVDREREAHAALGGPGARYAALTSRVTSLGQRLLTIADSIVIASMPGAPPAPGSEDSVRLAQVVRDSLQQDELAAIDRRYTLDTALLTALRTQHVRVASERARLESARAPALPTAGIVLAALIVGLAAGFSLVLLRELRRPSVGDLDEVRRVAGAAVLVHDAAKRSSSRAPLRDGASAARRMRERPGVPALIDRESDTFTVLHLALSGVGDLVQQVDVRSDQPLHAAAVALSTAAVAAGESRAVLVFAGAHDSVLPSVVGATRRAKHADSADVADAALHELTIDRDTHIDVLLSPPPTETARDRLLDRYDLRLALPVEPGESRTESWAPSRDVVLVARRGATALSWLIDGVRRAQAREQRIRAVVLWSGPRPRV